MSDIPVLVYKLSPCLNPKELVYRPHSSTGYRPSEYYKDGFGEEYFPQIDEYVVQNSRSYYGVEEAAVGARNKSAPVTQAWYNTTHV